MRIVEWELSHPLRIHRKISVDERVQEVPQLSLILLIFSDLNVPNPDEPEPTRILLGRRVVPVCECRQSSAPRRLTILD